MKLHNVISDPVPELSLKVDVVLELAKQELTCRNLRLLEVQHLPKLRASVLLPFCVDALEGEPDFRCSSSVIAFASAFELLKEARRALAGWLTPLLPKHAHKDLALVHPWVYQSLRPSGPRWLIFPPIEVDIESEVGGYSMVELFDNRTGSSSFGSQIARRGEEDS